MVSAGEAFSIEDYEYERSLIGRFSILRLLDGRVESR
jgi:hypothetical protein